ncbi:MAG: 50S ribosomal protein L7Ae [Nitrososphaerota archaeon]
MPNPSYVTFQPPEELIKASLETLRLARSSGKIKKGINETTKAIERGQAKLVLIAMDVDPPEIVSFLPILCEEKKIPYMFIPSKRELGEAAGIAVSASAAVIIEEGEAKTYLEEIIKKINELKTQKAISETK